MRLIGAFETEKEAYVFYSFLIKEGIQNIYEPFIEEKTGAKQYRIWVYDEDDLDMAVEWMNRFKQNPNEPQFQNLELPLAATPPPPDYAQITETEELKWKPVQSIRIKERHDLLAQVLDVLTYQEVDLLLDTSTEDRALAGQTKVSRIDDQITGIITSTGFCRIRACE